MSNVIVRGMKMPESCRFCPFESYLIDIGQTYCSANMKVLATAYKPLPYEGRHKNCPLFECKDWRKE